MKLWDGQKIYLFRYELKRREKNKQKYKQNSFPDLFCRKRIHWRVGFLHLFVTSIIICFGSLVKNFILYCTVRQGLKNAIYYSPWISFSLWMDCKYFLHCQGLWKEILLCNLNQLPLANWVSLLTSESLPLLCQSVVWKTLKGLFDKGALQTFTKDATITIMLFRQCTVAELLTEFPLSSLFGPVLL